MAILRLPAALLLVAAGLTLLVYSNGLNGPFLFDDHVHITQNRWAKIESLGWADLVQAWNSSFSEFPANRPLAQLSFGLNHAFSGLNPWAFKSTNLAIHLLIGLTLFLFVRLAYRALHHDTGDQQAGTWLAAVTATVWLLHPLHVSTVLYTVQRMAQISNLSMLLALVCYLYGRLRIADGRPGVMWMLAAAPIALIGFLGKENAVLLPLLLLVAEMTLLRRLPTGDATARLKVIRLVYIWLPLAFGAVYLASHTELFSYQGRPFTLEERLLTQARALWLYVSWLYVPDISSLGLFHDDVVRSTGWLSPPQTLLAVLAWAAVLAAALLGRDRFPLPAFAVLFYLANHALESSIFPLEMVFEHRNYLASLGPLLLLTYLVVIRTRQQRMRTTAWLVGGLLLISYCAATFIRVDNWSSYQSFALNAAENHPQSRRSNFIAAQILISAIDRHDGDIGVLAEAAEQFLDAGLAIDSGCVDCLFAKLVLDLHLDRKPDAARLDRLRQILRSGDVGPTQMSISQFSFLVRWHRSDDSILDRALLESIFEAAFANPRWNKTGRAGIESAYREYHEFATGDLQRAAHHGRNAVKAWPEQWGYYVHLVRVLQKQGLPADALSVLQQAVPALRNAAQRQEHATLLKTLRSQLQK